MPWEKKTATYFGQFMPLVSHMLSVCLHILQILFLANLFYFTCSCRKEQKYSTTVKTNKICGRAWAHFLHLSQTALFYQPYKGGRYYMCTLKYKFLKYHRQNISLLFNFFVQFFFLLQSRFISWVSTDLQVTTNGLPGEHGPLERQTLWHGTP